MALDTDTIVHAALELLRDEGLDGLTFRKLTARLDVKAPAIYWRFASKRELLEAMADTILAARLPDLAPYDGTGPWQDWFADLLHLLRLAMLDYPDGARVVIGARPQHAPTLGYLAEHGLAAAMASGVEVLDATTRVFTALHFTYGRAVEEQDSSGASRMEASEAAQFAARFPTVAGVLAQVQAKAVTPQDAFDAGIRLILR